MKKFRKRIIHFLRSNKKMKFHLSVIDYAIILLIKLSLQKELPEDFPFSFNISVKHQDVGHYDCSIKNTLWYWRVINFWDVLVNMQTLEWRLHLHISFFFCLEWHTFLFACLILLSCLNILVLGINFHRFFFFVFYVLNHFFLYYLNSCDSLISL